MTAEMNTRISTLIMRGLPAAEATAQARREAASHATWTTHRVGGHVVHAASGWTNGNSPTGLAIAVHLHKLGKSVTTDVDGGAHRVHAAGETCEHCA